MKRLIWILLVCVLTFLGCDQSGKQNTEVIVSQKDWVAPYTNTISTSTLDGEEVIYPQDLAEETVHLTVTHDIRYYVNDQEVLKEEVESSIRKAMKPGNRSIVMEIDSIVPTGITIQIFTFVKQNGWHPFIQTKRTKK